MKDTLIRPDNILRTQVALNKCKQTSNIAILGADNLLSAGPGNGGLGNGQQQIGLQQRRQASTKERRRVQRGRTIHSDKAAANDEETPTSNSGGNNNNWARLSTSVSMNTLSSSFRVSGIRVQLRFCPKIYLA